MIVDREWKEILKLSNGSDDAKLKLGAYTDAVHAHLHDITP